MKRLVLVVIIACIGFNIYAQTAEPPQLAFRILSDYATQKSNDVSGSTAGIVGISVGSLLLIGAGVSLYAGEQILPQIGINDPSAKWMFAWGFGITGGILIGGGFGVLMIPPTDYRAMYPLVFSESDPVVQEAMAVATLADLAQRGRNQRISQNVIQLGVPLLMMFGQIGLNVANNQDWAKNLANIPFYSAYSIVSAIYWLVFGKSEEELLYEKYQMARDAYYGSAR